LRKTVTKKQLQSVIGKLSYIADCIRSARLFISRLLDLLRTVNKKGHHINLNKEAKKDILWFLKFMDNFNGNTTIPDHQWCEPDHMIATDATLQGLGGICHKTSGTQVFHCNVPKHLEGTHIGVYEMLAILVGLRTWANYYKDKRILIQCDNSSCVSLLNTGRCRDNQMLSIARNIWMTCAKNNIQLKAVHIQAVDNRIPDILSRWQSLPSAFKQLQRLLPNSSYEFVIISDDTFDIDSSL